MTPSCFWTAAAPEQRVVVANKHSENLVGMLHHAGSNKVVVLCHGFAACKVLYMSNVMLWRGFFLVVFETWLAKPYFQGEFQYGNYKKEAADLHSVVLYLRQEKYDVAAIVGHSKGGLYASFGWYNHGIHYSFHHDVPLGSCHG